MRCYSIDQDWKCEANGGRERGRGRRWGEEKAGKCLRSRLVWGVLGEHDVIELGVVLLFSSRRQQKKHHDSVGGILEC